MVSRCLGRGHVLKWFWVTLGGRCGMHMHTSMFRLWPMHSQPQILLGCEAMPELHAKLVNLHGTRCLSADALASQVGMAWCLRS